MAKSKRAIVAVGVVVALISGALLAALILALPFGFLTMALAWFDPKLTIYKSAPGWVMLSPWIALAALISAGNLRLVFLEGKDGGADHVFRVRTDRYFGDPSAAETVNGDPGKRFVEDFSAFLSGREREGVEIGEPIGEDYGWGFWVGSRGADPLWVAFSYVGPVEEPSKVEETVVSVNLEPPFLPWKRLAFKPDIALRDKVQNHLKAFLAANEIAFEEEIED